MNELILEHSILSDVEEDCNENYLVPSLVRSNQVDDLINFSEACLELYIQFMPFLPGDAIKGLNKGA